MFNFQQILPSIPFILEGTLVTLMYTVSSVCIGSMIGCALAFGRVSSIKILARFTQVYVSIFRGTPLLVQLSLFYFATPQLTGYKISALEAGIFSFSLNSAAYIAEIIRAGIQAIPKGQTEAALSLGLGRFFITKDIILPQALKNILPALVNEFSSLLKESVIISIIGEMDLYRRARLVAAEKYIYFEPLLLIAGVYYILVMALTIFAKYLEKRLRKSD